MGRAVAITGALAKLIEDRLKLACPGENHPNVYRSEIEQEPKIVKVAVKERVFVVPFQFKSNAPFEAIYRVCWASIVRIIDPDKCSKFSLFPAISVECSVHLLRYAGESPSGYKNF